MSRVVEVHRVDDLDGPTAYFSRSTGASVDWTPEYADYWRRWDEYARLKSGLYFFAAVAAVGEEIAEWDVMKQTGFTP